MGLLVPAVLTAVEDPDPGCRWQAMGGAGVASARLQEALWQNPAGLAGAIAWRFGSTLSRPFGLSELAGGQFGVSLCRGPAGIAAACCTFGYSACREITTACALGYAFAPGLAFGVTLRHLHIAIERYGSAGALLCDLGGQLRCSARLRTGFCVRNLGNAVIGRCREPLPQSLQSGFAYAASRSALFNADLYLEKGQSLALRCGVDYLPASALMLRAGFNSAARRLAAGLALRRRTLTLEYSVTTHPWLGLSHQCGLSWSAGAQREGREP